MHFALFLKRQWILKFNRFVSFFDLSLRSKRFHGVWEQRKTEERGFRCFSRSKNGARAKKREKGLLNHFSRGQNEQKSRCLWLSLLPNPTETLDTQATLIYFIWSTNNILACKGVTCLVCWQRKWRQVDINWYVVKKCACRSAIRDGEAACTIGSSTINSSSISWCLSL